MGSQHDDSGGKGEADGPTAERTRSFEDAAKRRALPWSAASNALNQVFVIWTFGGSLFLLFLNELGLSKSRIGVLLSLFPFCGLLAVAVAPWTARFGRKRAFLLFYGTRKAVMAFLLLVPLVLDRAGPAAATAFVSAVILVFAVCRAVAETGYYPWNQEFVPNDVRGQYGSVLSVVSTLATLAALGLASHVLSHGTGLARFLWLIGAGAAIGGVSVALMLPVPGGVPEPDAPASGKHLSAMRTALRDRNFLAYLGGFGLVTLGSAFGSAFLPLFLTERLGMDPRMVVRMDMAAFAGGLAASFLWGWSADRHGSRPAVVASQSLAVAVPLLWLAVSRHGAAGWLLPAGLCAAGGVAVAGHTIAGGRWLMASVVPEENRTEYMALYYAWMGLAGGAGPILAGAVLAGLPGRGSESNGWAMDGYAALFLAGAAAVFAGLQCYRRVRPDGAFTTRTLAAGALDALLERLPFRR